MPIVIPGPDGSVSYGSELVLQILDADGEVAYDLNDGETTYVSPDGFDLGTPELEDSFFYGNSDSGRITRKRMRPCEMSWSQHVFTASVEDSRAEVAEIARLLREGPVLKYQHDADAEVRYIDTLTLNDIPSWLRGAFGIPAQYVSTTNRVEGMPIAVLRQPLMRGDELDSDVNLLKNSTLLWVGATANRPGLWALSSSSDITNETISSTATGPLPGWKGAAQYDIATSSARDYTQSTAAASAAPADVWTASFYARISAGNSSRMQAIIRFQDNAGADIGTDSASAATVLTSSWQRITVTSSAAPALTDRVKVTLRNNNSDSNSNTVQIAAAQLEKASSVSKYRVGTATVYNDPAATSGPGMAAPIYVHGDAATPLELEFTPAGGSTFEWLLVALRSGAQTAAYLNSAKAFQAEDGTMSIADSTVTASGSYSDGSYVNTTFATSAVLTARWYGTLTGAALDGLVGRTWDVYLMADSTQTEHNLALRAAFGSGSVSTTYDTVAGAISPYGLHKLARVFVDDDLTTVDFTLLAQRVAGAVALASDFFLFVPVDEHLATYDAPSFGGSATRYINERGAYEGAPGHALRVAGPQTIVPQPGIGALLVVMSNNLAVTLTDSVTMRVRYSPRYFS